MNITMTCANHANDNGCGSALVDPRTLSPELRALWRQMITFYKKKLGFSEKKAKEWTSRMIMVRQSGENDEVKNKT
jgi:hypothetical protein